MGITVEQAKQLTYGDYIYSNRFTNADGKSPIRWRVNGQVKTWKRDHNRLQIPVKHGLRDFAYLCFGEISNRVYVDSIVLDPDEFELDEDIAMEKCIL